MSLKKAIIVRSSIVYLGMALVGLAIFGKILHLQFFEKDKWGEEENSVISHKVIDPNRGNIYSSDGRLMAVSVPYYEIRMDFKSESFTTDVFDQGINGLSRSLSNLFKDRVWEKYKQDLTAARERGERYYLVKKNVTYAQLQEVRTFPIFRLGKYQGGVLYEQQTRRVRPYELLAARTVGYTRHDDHRGIVGLERAYDEQLRGEEGYRLMRKVKGDVWMPILNANEIEPRDGYDVVTTINIDLQDVAENALKEQLAKHGADHGTVIVMEVSTGKVRAIANLTMTEQGEYRENYNFAVGESTEPGSTFKLASVMALLEDGYVKPDDQVDIGDGVTYYYNQKMEDSGESTRGVITVNRAFEVSSNVGISKLVYEHYADRPEKFVNRLYDMGLNQKLGIEILGEGSPEIKYPDSELWSGLSLPWMSIGYEVRMTPLQILAFYNGVANEGRVVKPLFVEEIRAHGKVVERNEPEVLKMHLCSRETLGYVKTMLEGVVEDGTAANLAKSHYKIAGKTGTAQVSLSKEGYTEHLYQASFAGYFPADDPRYSCIVVVNGPSKNIFYGNVVAGPIFTAITDRIYVQEYDLHEHELADLSDVVQAPYSKSGNRQGLEDVFDYLDMPLQDESVADANWVSTSKTEEGVVARQRTQPGLLVPNVVDMGLSDAVYLLESRGLQVKVNGRGTVRGQSQIPGALIRKGSLVNLDMSLKEI